MPSAHRIDLYMAQSYRIGSEERRKLYGASDGVWVRIGPCTRRVLMRTDIEFNPGGIEGFFGKPWDRSARLSGVDFLRDCGYQFYIYAPKADSFLRPRWRGGNPAQAPPPLSEISPPRPKRGPS